jgi:hypothetical protein
MPGGRGRRKSWAWYVRGMNPYRSFLFAVVAALPGCGESGTACMAVEPGSKTCPAARDVDKHHLRSSCGAEIYRITGEGRLNDDINPEDNTKIPGCCYPVMRSETTCKVGRPLRVEHAPLLAPAALEPRWAAATSLRMAALTPAQREALGERWTRAALEEHASIAAFSRVALDLLRHGAPPELVEQAHLAALDEVRHARQSFAIAGALAGRPVGPGCFPLPATLPLAADLVAVAAEAALDGCIGETVASLLAREAAEVCADPDIRDVLAGIADDEQRHALLGWRTVAWALRVGGPEVREAVAAVFAAAAREGVAAPLSDDCDDPVVLARVGLHGREAARRCADRALYEVILPGARVLLATDVRRDDATATAPA